MIVSGGWGKFSSGVLIRRKLRRAVQIGVLLVLPVLFFSYETVYADGWLGGDPAPGQNLQFPSRAGNEIKNNETFGVRGTIGGIANTRHNLTMSYNSGVVGMMDPYRNDYYEICVYCHTPHGANSTAAAPLWNRTVTAREYTLYQNKDSGNEPSAMSSTFTQPGPNSLTCLSCHDGVTAIDSIINMPTQLSGEFRAGYSQAQETVADIAAGGFLDQWSGNALGTGGPGDDGGQGHAGFASGGAECIACHNAGVQMDPNNPESHRSQAPNFLNFVIGTDLTNDHPIGVSYPTKFDASVDFNEPDIKTGRIAFFDTNGNAHAEPNEIRLYDTGDGYEVECGSCHDPHGVKVENTDSNMIVPSFLRVGSIMPQRGSTGPAQFPRSNVGSSLCLTCHVK